MASKAVLGFVAVLLLCASNAFMTTAWFLHLKFKSWGMAKAIFISWGIALFEYCLMVPANRLGHFSGGGPFTAPQLKIIQEFITLTCFAIFSILVLKEKLRWMDMIAFGLIFAGVAVGLVNKPSAKDQALVPPPPPLPEQPPAEPGSPSEVQAAQQQQQQPGDGQQAVGRKLLVQLGTLWGKKTGSDDGSVQAGKGTSGPVDQEGEGEAELVGTRVSQQVQHTGSTEVLLANDANVHHTTSSQREVHHRELGSTGSEPGAAAAAEDAAALKV